MINFDQFIKVIHDSALSANKALMDENLKVIDNYFESIEKAEIIDSSLDEALDLVNKVLRKKDASKNELKEAVQKLMDTRYAAQHTGHEGKEMGGKTLKPKTVVLQYPMPTQHGIAMKDVEIPLISLIPVSMSEISEIKFKANIEIVVDDSTLKVGFPNKAGINKTDIAPGNESHYSSLEITVRPRESSDGLTTLIQGYEKALRAQIPF